MAKLRTQGFSLPSILVAMGLVSILFMALVTMIQNTHQETRNADIRLQGQSLTSSLVQVLSSPSGCTLNLVDPANPTIGMTIPSTALTDPTVATPVGVDFVPVTNVSGTLTRNTGTPLIQMVAASSTPPPYVATSGSLKVRTYAIRFLSATSAPNTYLANIEITLARNIRDGLGNIVGAKSTGTDNYQLPAIPVTVEIAAGRVNQCTYNNSSGGGPANENDICTMMGGVYNASAVPKCTVLEEVRVSTENCTNSATVKGTNGLICPANKFVTNAYAGSDQWGHTNADVAQCCDLYANFLDASGATVKTAVAVASTQNCLDVDGNKGHLCSGYSSFQDVQSNAWVITNVFSNGGEWGNSAGDHAVESRLSSLLSPLGMNYFPTLSDCIISPTVDQINGWACPAGTSGGVLADVINNFNVFAQGDHFYCCRLKYIRRY